MTKTREESEAREYPDGRNRRILGLAALEASGESGFRKLTVEGIAEWAGLDAESFYEQFDGPAGCYASGYVTTIEDLVADLVAAAKREPSWVLGMRKGLYAVGRFVEAEPLLARGIFLEVYVAGGAAQAKRDEVFERLSRAVDRARRENASRHSPPPIASTFILNMVEAAVARWLQTDEPSPFGDAVPDLLYLAVTFYYGREAADRMVRRPPA